MDGASGAGPEDGRRGSVAGGQRAGYHSEGVRRFRAVRAPLGRVQPQRRVTHGVWLPCATPAAPAAADAKPPGFTCTGFSRFRCPYELLGHRSRNGACAGAATVRRDRRHLPRGCIRAVQCSCCRGAPAFVCGGGVARMPSAPSAPPSILACGSSGPSSAVVATPLVATTVAGRCVVPANAAPSVQPYADGAGTPFVRAVPPQACAAPVQPSPRCCAPATVVGGCCGGVALTPRSVTPRQAPRVSGSWSVPVPGGAPAAVAHRPITAGTPVGVGVGIAAAGVLRRLSTPGPTQCCAAQVPPQRSPSQPQLLVGWPGVGPGDVALQSVMQHTPRIQALPHQAAGQVQRRASCGGEGAFAPH
mmetsp:Transcript_124652/g.358032  ORF Transcript_124652/g.358032 Transcript_124652/m.358032 type:complete len:360 (+) Transcript_124652:867-1946(+)